MTEGIDYAWQHPSIAALQAAGITFACRYLSRDPSKNLTAPEAQQLHAAGIATVSNWEAAAGAARGGFSQGQQDATDAAAQHAADGGPADRPIYFSVDWDVVSTDFPAVDAYFRGVASVIGLPRTGAYGGYRVIKHLLDSGLIRWAWQTYAWSAGQWDARAHIHQIRNGVLIGGVDSDLDQNMVTDYGQWGVTDMEQTDKVIGNLNRGNTIGDVFADLSNDRDWWYQSPGTPGKNPPPSGSRADIVLRAAQQVLAAGPVTVTLTDAQATTMANQIATVLAARPDVPLSDADKPTIVAAVKQALTEGVGS